MKGTGKCMNWHFCFGDFEIRVNLGSLIRWRVLLVSIFATSRFVRYKPISQISRVNCDQTDYPWYSIIYESSKDRDGCVYKLNDKFIANFKLCIFIYFFVSSLYKYFKPKRTHNESICLFALRKKNYYRVRISKFLYCSI